MSTPAPSSKTEGGFFFGTFSNTDSVYFGENQTRDCRALLSVTRNDRYLCYSEAIAISLLCFDRYKEMFSRIKD